MMLRYFAGILLSMQWIVGVSTTNGLTPPCCTRTIPNKTKSTDILSYLHQDAPPCAIKAVRFNLINGKTLCSDPNSKWAIHAMGIVDRRTTTTPIPTTVNVTEILSYDHQNAPPCDINAVRFNLTNGKTLCSDPNSNWARHAMKIVDLRTTTTTTASIPTTKDNTTTRATPNETTTGLESTTLITHPISTPQVFDKNINIISTTTTKMSTPAITIDIISTTTTKMSTPAITIDIISTATTKMSTPTIKTPLTTTIKTTSLTPPTKVPVTNITPEEPSVTLKPTTHVTLEQPKMTTTPGQQNVNTLGSNIEQNSTATPKAEDTPMIRIISNMNTPDPNETTKSIMITNQTTSTKFGNKTIPWTIKRLKKKSKKGLRKVQMKSY